VHHVGILYDQFMMHGRRNIKLVNMLMNLLQGITWLTEQLFASQEGVRSLKLQLQLGEVTFSEDIESNIW